MIFKTIHNEPERDRKAKGVTSNNRPLRVSCYAYSLFLFVDEVYVGKVGNDEADNVNY